MKHGYKMLMRAAGSLISASTSWADTLATHRIPAALAVEAANETVAACAKQGYRETAVVLDADGAIIAAVRGDGAGIHTLDAPTTRHTPLFLSKTIHSLWPSVPRARIRLRHLPSCRTSCSSVVAW
jgi:hypothetical protein